MTNIVLIYLASLSVIGLLELLVFTTIYVISFQRKRCFPVRITGGIAALFAVELMASFGVVALWAHGVAIEITSMEVFRIFLNIIRFIGWISLMFFAFEEKPALLLYAAIASECSYCLFSALYNILITFSGSFSIYVAILDPIDFWSVFFYVLSLLAVLAVSYFLFAHPLGMLKKEFGKTINKFILLTFLALVFFIVGIQGSNIVAGSDNNKIVILFNVFIVIFCLVILVVERFMLFWVKDLQEKAATERLYENYRLQSELSKESIQLVNIKCHDLRHQIRSLSGAQSLPEEFLEDVQKTISIYDTHIQTGNDALDTVLTEKSLRCEVEGILLTAMIDGEALSFLSVADIYSLFGNALDNAIEHLRTEAPENRFLRVSSRRQGDMLSVRVENYCTQKIGIGADGLPVTTKEDKDNHGFGVRSMKNIVENYGGMVRFSVEDCLFVALIVFPG